MVTADMTLEEDLGRAQTQMLIDNNSAFTVTKNPGHHRKAKHIEISYLVLRNRVKNKQITVERVALKDNLADFFTKAVSQNMDVGMVRSWKRPSNATALAGVPFKNWTSPA
ncbi:hypothetical protein AnigIFM62618_005996 [Aspergillus niger]|nr:hypothetical protein AnigIFM62618_005996 [Aspergillus niger]